MRITTQVAQTGTPAEAPIKTAAEQKDKPKMDNPDLAAKVDLNKEELSASIEKLNKTLQIYNKHLKFSVHKESGRVMVQVINNDTGEVIREIPPKKILDMLAKIQEYVGLLVDEQA